MAKKAHAVKNAASAVTAKKRSIKRTVRKVKRGIKALQLVSKAAKKLL